MGYVPRNVVAYGTVAGVFIPSTAKGAADSDGVRNFLMPNFVMSLGPNHLTLDLHSRC
jgi:hypothetical protein